MATKQLNGRIRLDEIKIHGVRNLNTGRFTVTGLTIDEQLVVPTTEFWNDLFYRFNLTAGWADGKSNVRRFEWLVAHFGEYELPYQIHIDDEFNALIFPNASQACVKGTPKEVVVLDRKRAIWNQRQSLGQPTVARPAVPKLPAKRCACRARLRNCRALETSDSADCPHTFVLKRKKAVNQPAVINEEGRTQGYKRLLEAIQNVEQPSPLNN